MKVTKVNFYGDMYYVFDVQVNTGIVKMRCRADYVGDEDDYFVVMIDRYRFESLWYKLNDSTVPHLARGTVEAWKTDDNYTSADEGFSFSIDSPVPLAEVKSVNDFINGYTRTIWLMANGAKQFPVYVYDRVTAEELLQSVGVKGSQCYSNRDLHKLTNNEVKI
mgnify:CR=1 FL=1